MSIGLQEIDVFFGALGSVATTAAVIIALILSYREAPCLKVLAIISCVYPENEEYLHLYCINSGTQPITPVGFALNTNRFNKYSDRFSLYSIQ